MANLQCYYCSQPVSSAADACASCNRPLVLHDRYQLIKVLGKGGFGIVFEAVDRRLSRRCAIKALAAASMDEQKQIEGEASILSQYASQFAFIPDIYDIWSDTAQTYMVMEFIAGHSLDKLLIKPWPAVHAESFLRAVLDHLVQLHGADIIHRDLKPANIRRTPEGRYTLLDFGIAKQGAVTQTAAKALSLDYTSPEQLQGRATDARSDLYSLAATTYHALTGQPPGRADARLAGSRVLQPPGQLVGGVPPALDGLLQRMLELNPERRPPSAQAALQLLDDPAAATAVLPVPQAGSVSQSREGEAPDPGGQAPAGQSSAGMPTLPISSAPPQPINAAQPLPPAPPGTHLPAYLQDAAANVPAVGGTPQRQVQRPKTPLTGRTARRTRWLVEALVVGFLIIVATVAYLSYTSGRRPTRTAADRDSGRSAGMQQRIQTQTALDRREEATQEALEAPTVNARETAQAQEAATSTAEIQATKSSPLQTTAIARSTTAQTAWPPKIYDTFDNNKNSWPLSISGGSSSRGSLGIINGIYQWDMRALSGALFNAWPESDPVSTFYLAADVQKLRGASSGYGLLFRQTSPDDYYIFLINDSQSFACFRNSRGRSDPLINWTQSSAIQTEGSNRLSVVAEGSRFMFYINDFYVGQAQDSSLQSGFVGVAAVLFADGQVAYEFDNFQLHAP